MDAWIRPQLWMSEFISGFIFTLIALIAWTVLHRKSSGVDDKWKKRVFTAMVLLGATVASMFSGMVVSGGANDFGPASEGGHGWGNPSISMGLAFGFVVGVFSNINIFILGIFYVIFNFIGAAFALGAFVIWVWIHNQTHSEKEDLIFLNEIFKFDTSHPVRAFGNDAIAALIVTFTFMGATYLATDLPSAFPSEVLFRFTSVIAGAIAMMTVGLLFGERMLLVINPIVWTMAFVLKFSSHIMRNQKFRFVFFVSEFASFAATMGAGLAVGLATFGIINLPHTVWLDGKVA